MNPLDGSLQKKTSFYYPLLLLPVEKRDAMEILYRFCWAADEIADGPGSPAGKKRSLSAFRRNLRSCFSGNVREPFFQRLREVVRRFGLSREPLERILEGVGQDLRPLRFRTFAELHAYARRVAGGPGLASMEIFGFKDRRHRDYAENLGVFLQLVNITRDFREDLDLGRQYLPQEDFKRFHLDPRRIEAGDSHWKPFVEFQLDRAWSYLERARKCLTPRERCALATAEAIAAVYVKLRQKIKNNPYRVLEERISLSPMDKLISVTGALGRCWLWKRRGA